ncbi:MAG: type III pantothenate kinase [Spirochaetes bacterium]|nr:type III pantothenate kinase [Spirochaetota bacterium]
MVKKNEIICIDIGNTNAKCAVFDEYGNESLFHSSKNCELPQMLDNLPAIKLLAYSCVNPVFEESIISFCEKNKKTMLKISDMLNLGFINNYNSTAGADRLANAAAASALFPDDNVIVVDAGSAINIEVIESSVFKGGVILPGISTSFAALTEKTAMLKKLKYSKPSSIIGQNSSENISSGIFYGTIGALKYILDEISRESGKTYKVILTGGDAELISGSIDSHLNDRLFTLRGIKFLADKNLINI